MQNDRSVAPKSPYSRIFTVQVILPPNLAPPSEYIMIPMSELFIAFLSLTIVVVRTIESADLHYDRRGAPNSLYFGNFYSATMRKND